MDIRELRRLACQGVPDAAGIRSTVWKVRFSFPLVSDVLFFTCVNCDPASVAVYS